jgi:hypothetical protein
MFSPLVSLQNYCHWGSRLARGQLYHRIIISSYLILFSTYILCTNICGVSSYFKNELLKAIYRCYYRFVQSIVVYLT